MGALYLETILLAQQHTWYVKHEAPSQPYIHAQPIVNGLLEETISRC